MADPRCFDRRNPMMVPRQYWAPARENEIAKSTTWTLQLSIATTWAEVASHAVKNSPRFRERVTPFPIGRRHHIANIDSICSPLAGFLFNCVSFIRIDHRKSGGRETNIRNSIRFHHPTDRLCSVDLVTVIYPLSLVSFFAALFAPCYPANSQDASVYLS